MSTRSSAITPAAARRRSKRGVSLARIAELVSANPARNFGLYPKEGCIAVGADADFAIVDMEAEKQIRSDELLSAQDHTPFEGFMTKGWRVKTMIRGRVMYDDGKVTEEKCSEFIKRPTALHSVDPECDLSEI